MKDQKEIKKKAEDLPGTISTYYQYRDLVLGQNLEIRLVRRLLRWDLRERSIYSGAVVYDCTYLAKGQIYQTAAFMLREEFQGRKIFIMVYLSSSF